MNKNKLIATLIVFPTVFVLTTESTAYESAEKDYNQKIEESVIEESVLEKNSITEDLGLEISIERNENPNTDKNISEEPEQIEEIKVVYNETIKINNFNLNFNYPSWNIENVPTQKILDKELVLFNFKENSFLQINSYSKENLELFKNNYYKQLLLPYFNEMAVKYELNENSQKKLNELLNNSFIDTKITVIENIYLDVNNERIFANEYSSNINLLEYQKYLKEIKGIEIESFDLEIPSIVFYVFELEDQLLVFCPNINSEFSSLENLDNYLQTDITKEMIEKSINSYKKDMMELLIESLKEISID